MFLHNRFQDKLAIVTGSADGIGKAIAQRLGQEGANLAMIDNNATLLTQTIEEFEQMGVRATPYITDISNSRQVSDSVLQIEKKFKKIDILVHAAGIVGPTNTKITEYSDTDFDKIYNVNFKGFLR